jgi:UDP-GlcNAc:undecaprenyl-phosphate GlcNAc-1-phosphate transferase
MIYMSGLLISLFITIGLIPLFRKAALRLQAVDFPAARKVHLHPMPKCGGLPMAIGALVPMLFWLQGNRFLTGVTLGAVILVIFGLLDDFRDLPYWLKFVGQAAAGLLVIFLGGLEIRSLGTLLPDDALLPSWIGVPLTLVVVVGVTNAINLSDGLDGLAGGITLLSFLLIGYLAFRIDHTAVALLCCTAMGAVFGFLRFNTYPASLFMGDAGSQLLGFLAVTLSLHITQVNAPLSPLLPLIILGFPILDTMTVMAQRISEGRSPFEADKGHFHHRLLGLGLFHTEAVVLIYLVQGFLVTAGYVLRYYSDWFLLGFYLLFSGLVLAGFHHADRVGWRVRRFALVDRVIKGRLRVLKEKQLLVRVSYQALKTGLPLLLFAACLLPADVPAFFSVVSVVFAGSLLAAAAFKPDWLIWMLRVCFYPSVPLIVYLGHASLSAWAPPRLRTLYLVLFGVLALLSVLTLKFTRREKGFKATPMDILILFIALVVPNLPAPLRTQHLGVLTTQVVALLFSFEVLMGELRGEYRRLAVAVAGALALAGISGPFS